MSPLPSAGVLAVMGDLLEDVVVRMSGPPRLGTDMPSIIGRTTGGSAANVARTAAALASAAGRSAPAVRFIGNVGDDPLGALLVDALVRDGIDVRVTRRGRTGSVVVLVEPGGERTMLPDRAAALQFEIDDAGADAALGGADWLHLTSYSFVLEPLAANVRRLLAGARRARVGVSLDASSTGIIETYGVERFGALLAELAPDVLFANEAEAALLAAQPTTGVYVVKRGGAPAEVRRPGVPVVRVPAEQLAEVVDSTGAGDAFAAGYLIAALSGTDLVDAVGAGHRAAADVLRAARRGELPALSTVPTSSRQS